MATARGVAGTANCFNSCGGLVSAQQPGCGAGVFKKSSRACISSPQNFVVRPDCCFAGGVSCANSATQPRCRGRLSRLERQGSSVGFFSHSRTGDLRADGRASAGRSLNGAFWDGADSESTADLWVPQVKEESQAESESVLLKMVRDIEPLDTSRISKDASPDSTGAMKRTISGMLGLLPSDQFQVTIETSTDELSRLYVSSMMTGYTLRNAEYRLSLQRTLELEEVAICPVENKSVESVAVELDASGNGENDHHGVNGITPKALTDLVDITEDLGVVPSNVAQYIHQLQEKLSATSKELEAFKARIKNAEPTSRSGPEINRSTKNDLLDYLRALDPVKVEELSQPSGEVRNAIHEVATGLLGALISESSASVSSVGTSSTASRCENSESPETVGSSPLQSRFRVTSSRDFLARLLFWCTLLGYYMRGLEYRLELSRTLRLSGEGDHRGK